MPNDKEANEQPVVTNSWTSYQKLITRIKEFLSVVSVRDTEVWLDEVCLGSTDRPWIRAPFETNSAERVSQAIECVRHLIADIQRSLHGAIDTSRLEMEVLINKGADRADFSKLVARLEALNALRTELSRAATSAPFDYHPAVLVSWYDILQETFGQGDPVVRVKVTTTYVL